MIYGQVYACGAVSVGSRQPWSADVFLRLKAVDNWLLATTIVLISLLGTLKVKPDTQRLISFID